MSEKVKRMGDRNTGIKICGMRRKEDIEAANRCRPDYIGFILSSGFRRSVEPEEARRLSEMLDEGIRTVGVFVNEPVEAIAAAGEFLDMIQLHGREDNSFIEELREAVNKPIVQAFRIRNRQDLDRAMESTADILLLDNGTGTGEVFDWSIICEPDRPWILAGGLGPDNIAEALQRFTPYAVDLSSGAETDGWKDPEKMRQCVEAVRGSQII